MHDVLFRGVHDVLKEKNACPGLGSGGVTLFAQGKRTAGSSQNTESQNQLGWKRPKHS